MWLSEYFSDQFVVRLVRVTLLLREKKNAVLNATKNDFYESFSSLIEIFEEYYYP
jgi:hypothetical protein